MYLFSPLIIRNVTFRNRIGVSPMCQYSSENGFPNDWHLVHLGSRAVGGAGLVIVEATAVTSEGRISPGDLGIWLDEHVPAYRRIADFLQQQGAVAGIQLAHAGRKASTSAPWQGGESLSPERGGWSPILGPSPIPFETGDQTPKEMTLADIEAVTHAFADATRRSLEAGFKVLEIHAAHGYLLHEFLSPLSNHRRDQYGGAFENRIRLLCEVVMAVRKIWPETLPLFVRISATDWAEGGWNLEESVRLATELKPLGVDLIDCSSGALVPNIRIPVGSGYQVPFAEAIRRDSGVMTAAVGMITGPRQAEEIIASGQADMVLLARELLRDPYWPLHAATELEQEVSWPVQYERAKPRLKSRSG